MSILAVPDVLGLIATTAMTYITIIALIRISGKRSTSQMNNFDWVVTVTLGSISASMILLEDVTWAEGTIAMATLVLLQFGLTKAVRRFPKIARLVKPPPATLYEKGEWNDEKMRRERVTRSEVLAAVRHNGHDSLSRIQKIILETDASLSVIPVFETQKDQ
ncbi:MAG: DUF421 domain-containing protein [Erythrobacter sp.]|jgi:uncharacterized membrane protein YcaP (DUF421 family)|nr:DUF421 domain-containing protein [Erythrobacter sp.]